MGNLSFLLLFGFFWGLLLAGALIHVTTDNADYLRENSRKFAREVVKWTKNGKGHG